MKCYPQIGQCGSAIIQVLVTTVYDLHDSKHVARLWLTLKLFQCDNTLHQDAMLPTVQFYCGL